MAASTLGLLVVTACGDADQAPPEAQVSSALCPEADTSRSYWVCAVGDRRVMLETGNLQGQVSLGDLPASPNLLAVGPIKGLKGEITVDQGTVYLSTIVDGELVVREGSEAEAIFLASGAANAWRKIPVMASYSGFDAIEAFIREAASEVGIDPERPFPFRITGTPATLDYHVIFRAGHSGHGQHDRAAHEKAKVPFEASGQHVSIVGIWADMASIGQYTHKGRRTHMHAVLDDVSGAGHVDALELSPGMVLHLPASSETAD